MLGKLSVVTGFGLLLLLGSCSPVSEARKGELLRVLHAEFPFLAGVSESETVKIRFSTITSEDIEMEFGDPLYTVEYLFVLEDGDLLATSTFHVSDGESGAGAYHVDDRFNSNLLILPPDQVTTRVLMNQYSGISLRPGDVERLAKLGPSDAVPVDYAERLERSARPYKSRVPEHDPYREFWEASTPSS